MALGTQLSPTQTLVTFCLWARRHGYDVGEMHGFSAVHPVHTGGSWHFDSDGGFGKAADINKNGPDERAELIEALNRAQELGLGRDLRPGRGRGGQRVAQEPPARGRRPVRPPGRRVVPAARWRGRADRGGAACGARGAGPGVGSGHRHARRGREGGEQPDGGAVPARGRVHAAGGRGRRRRCVGPDVPTCARRGHGRAPAGARAARERDLGRRDGRRPTPALATCAAEPDRVSRAAARRRTSRHHPRTGAACPGRGTAAHSWRSPRPRRRSRRP